MIDFDFDALTDAQQRDSYARLDALEKRCHEAKEQLRERMLDRMDKQPENAMVGNVIIATVQKRQGGSKTRYRVVNPIAYAAWLDRVGAVLDDERATTTVRYPKSETMDDDYITLLVEQGGGALPKGVEAVKPRADSIAVKYAPGIMDRLFNGDLSPAIRGLLTEGERYE